MEKAVVKQIVEAIEPKYMKILRDRRTNTISRTVAQVLHFLFERWGEIECKDLQEKEEEDRTMT